MPEVNAIFAIVPTIWLTIVALFAVSALKGFAERGNWEPNDRSEKYPKIQKAPKRKEAQEDLVEIEI